MNILFCKIDGYNKDFFAVSKQLHTSKQRDYLFKENEATGQGHTVSKGRSDIGPQVYQPPKSRQFLYIVSKQKYFYYTSAMSCDLFYVEPCQISLSWNWINRSGRRIMEQKYLFKI